LLATYSPESESVFSRTLCTNTTKEICRHEEYHIQYWHNTKENIVAKSRQKEQAIKKTKIEERYLYLGFLDSTQAVVHGFFYSSKHGYQRSSSDMESLHYLFSYWMHKCKHVDAFCT